MADADEKLAELVARLEAARGDVKALAGLLDEAEVLLGDAAFWGSVADTSKKRAALAQRLEALSVTK